MPIDPIRVRDLFLAAIDLPPEGRPEYLADACGTDAALRAEVEKLLAAHAKPDSLLEPAPPDATGAFDPEAHQFAETAAGNFGDTPTRRESFSTALTLGTVIASRYTLVEVIGEGGMGSVYLASQSEPVKRQVALKLIKTGMDSKAVLARFDAERQALALMDHPNIARIYDGGVTPTGQPFFVMELVKGVPLTEYCDAQRLSVKARLELFVSVCQAVQHAHQKGIIHRDLKPGNVLVTEVDGRPTPKVIDFGVAKATEQQLTEMSFSDTGAIVGTPAYMSPEQADPSSMDIDTRTDVYALGVMLYELLTGSPPIDAKQFKRGAILEMLRMVREVEPPRPSTRLSAANSRPNIAANRSIEPAKLAKLLQGELDWVVMKSLEKDRTRRYDTANGLALDIQRYLADEVVEARPPSTGYRLKKFVRRHKGQVIAASLVLFVLMGGIVGTTWGLFEARRQEQLARDETTEKEQARLAEAERVKERDAALKAEAERSDELKQRLGVSEMVLAGAAYDNRDVKLANERLDKVPARQRGWEWHYLKRQSVGGIFTLKHVGPITCIAVSPDGTRIATASGGQHAPFEAKVWDARTGAFLFELKGLPEKVQGVNTPVVSVAFSADSKRIVTGRGDKTARLWDATTGALQLELKDHTGEVMSAAFSPDGKQVATAHDGGNLKVWDARTGAVHLDLKAHKNRVARVVYSPDGSRIVTGSYDRAVRVWDAKSGERLLDAKGVMNIESTVAISPDGTRIIVGGDEGEARVIDARTGAILLVLQGRSVLKQSYSMGTAGVLSAAFSPDGSRIVTGGGVNMSGDASVWDARTGAELLELKGHAGKIYSVSFSADGMRIVTGSGDGTAKVWDARTGTPRLELDGITGAVQCVSLSRDGTQIVAGGGRANNLGHATIWDARTGEPKLELKGFKGSISSAAISPDGTRIVTGGGEYELPGQATVWDARTGTALFELKGLKEGVTSVAFSPDGSRIATGGGDADQNQGNEAKVWDARTGALLLDLTQPNMDGGYAIGTRVAVAFSPDSKRIIVGGARSMNDLGDDVRIWDVTTGERQLESKTGHGGVRSVAFSPDGTRFVTGGIDSTAKVFDARTGSLQLDLKGHTGDVNSVAFSPDPGAPGRIVTGSGDRTVRVWDARTGTTLAELKGHTGPVTSVTFSMDGMRIVTGGGRMNGEVFAWDARIGKELPDQEEIAYRRLCTEPSVSRYRETYLAAHAAKNEFAAAFYLNLVPLADRADLLAQAERNAFAALSKLAQEHQWAGKLDEALPLLIEILNINKAKLGPDDPATINAMDTLGRIYNQTGQYEKSVPMLEDVWKARKAKLGPDNPQTLNAIGMLGMAYKDSGRLQKAIVVLEEGAAKNEWVMQNLIDVYTLADEHGKVVELLLKELEATRKTTPAENLPFILPHKLARVSKAYLVQKKWAEAEPYLREDLTIREKIQADEWGTFDTQSKLGGALLGQMKYAEAEPMLLKGYEGMKQREKSIPPHEHLQLPKSLDRLIEFYTATNKPDEAKKWQAERAKYKETAPMTKVVKD